MKEITEAKLIDGIKQSTVITNDWTIRLGNNESTEEFKACGYPQIVSDLLSPNDISEDILEQLKKNLIQNLELESNDLKDGWFSVQKSRYSQNQSRIVMVINKMGIYVSKSEVVTSYDYDTEPYSIDEDVVPNSDPQYVKIENFDEFVKLMLEIGFAKEERIEEFQNGERNLLGSLLERDRNYDQQLKEFRDLLQKRINVNCNNLAFLTDSVRNPGRKRIYIDIKRLCQELKIGLPTKLQNKTPSAQPPKLPEAQSSLPNSQPNLALFESHSPTAVLSNINLNFSSPSQPPASVQPVQPLQFLPNFSQPSQVSSFVPNLQFPSPAQPSFQSAQPFQFSSNFLQFSQTSLFAPNLPQVPVSRSYVIFQFCDGLTRFKSREDFEKTTNDDTIYVKMDKMSKNLRDPGAARDIISKFLANNYDVIVTAPESDKDFINANLLILFGTGIDLKNKITIKLVNENEPRAISSFFNDLPKTDKSKLLITNKGNYALGAFEVGITTVPMDKNEDDKEYFRKITQHLPQTQPAPPTTLSSPRATGFLEPISFKRP